MKFRMFIDEHLMFESEGGDLLVTKDILKIAGFDKGFAEMSFRIRDDVAEVHFKWDPYDGLTQEEAKELTSGSVIVAIKSLRARKPGLGLKEAKDFCDNWRDRHGIAWRTVAPVG